MRCSKLFTGSAFLSRSFARLCLLLFILISLSGCEYAHAWNDQAFESHSSTIMQGIDSKFRTLSELKKNNPELLKPYLKERGEKEITLNKRQQQISLDHSFLKIWGLGFSAWQTGLGGGAISLVVGLLAMIMRRKGKEKLKEELHKGKEKLKKELLQEELLELGMVAYAGKKINIDKDKPS